MLTRTRGARFVNRIIGALLGVLAVAPRPAAAWALPAPRTYHFTLIKGAGTPVCDANLARLNTATYTGPPACDQPETTKVPGFTPLHRVPLSAREIYRVIRRVDSFITFGKQGSKAQEEARAALRKRLGLPPLTPFWTYASVRSYVQQGDIKVWRYDPPVDIGNDGRPTNLVIWQGMPINNGPGVCGQPAPMGYRVFYTQPQVAFVLAPGDKRLDTRKTKELFGRRGPKYRFPDGTVPPGFELIGTSIGIFRYRGLYYFETFFNGWGGSKPSDFSYYPALTHTLGVFLRRHGHTREVCEYHMTVHHVPMPQPKDSP